MQETNIEVDEFFSPRNQKIRRQQAFEFPASEAAALQDYHEVQLINVFADPLRKG